jgi:hypothetical protein
MGASWTVWVNALAAIKEAIRNAKDSARIVILRHYLAPTTSEAKATRQIKGAVARASAAGRPQLSRGRPDTAALVSANRPTRVNVWLTSAMRPFDGARTLTVTRRCVSA